MESLKFGLGVTFVGIAPLQSALGMQQKLPQPRPDWDMLGCHTQRHDETVGPSNSYFQPFQEALMGVPTPEGATLHHVRPHSW